MIMLKISAEASRTNLEHLTCFTIFFLNSAETQAGPGCVPPRPVASLLASAAYGSFIFPRWKDSFLYIVV